MGAALVAISTRNMPAYEYSEKISKKSTISRIIGFLFLNPCIDKQAEYVALPCENSQHTA